MPMQLLDFTTLDTGQLTLVLSWRNHPNIRKWMLRDNEISMEEHLCFVQSLKNRPDKRYFLLQKSQDYLGVVDLTNINATGAELGIYANPDLHGVGKLLMSALIDYAHETLKLTHLIANVFADNEKAKDLYQKFDFVEIHRTAYNGREMITLERTL